MTVQSNSQDEIVDLIMDNPDKQIDVQIGDAIYKNVKVMDIKISCNDTSSIPVNSTINIDNKEPAIYRVICLTPTITEV